jgi:hypothetical protein
LHPNESVASCGQPIAEAKYTIASGKQHELGISSCAVVRMSSVLRALIVLVILGVVALDVLADDPPAQTEPPLQETGINWSGLALQSLEFLGIEHGFRWVTEEGTRHPHHSFFDGYIDSLNSLHGWADGDPFYVSYVGHPMQGAVAGYIFVQNDMGYRDVEFGRIRRYWKSRLRAAAFAWAYSEQFEIGPVSEASIGNGQAFFPQQGFVDQVATPAIGLAWMIAEDAMDRYVVRRIESHTQSPFARLLVRGGLNPTRSMANLIGGRVPWHRDTRPGVWESPELTVARPSAEVARPLAVAPFEFLATARVERYFGKGSHGLCAGGGGAGAFRFTPHWQIVGDVGGCKLTSFGPNLSGDSLTYLIGPRWTAAPLKRWEPYAQILIGGRTLTHEEIDPVKKALVEAEAQREGKALSFSDHYLYTRQSENTGLAISARAGLDVKLTSAVAIRVTDFGFVHSWHSKLDGINYSNALQVTSGLIVRFGTW